MATSNAAGRAHQSTSFDDKPVDEQLEVSIAPSESEVEHANVLALASHYVPGSNEEKRLLRKLDFRIIVSDMREQSD